MPVNAVRHPPLDTTRRNNAKSPQGILRQARQKMAINIIMIDWFIKLYNDGIFNGRKSMIELGPQDFIYANIHDALSRFNSLPSNNTSVGEFISNGRYLPFSQSVLYRRLGIESYTCSDSIDPRANYKLDLNVPLPPDMPKFDVVTNFGTLEHIFDVAQAFSNIDGLLADNGIVLHLCPALGDINHGLWNLHPTTFFDIARENGYDILAYDYVDNVYVRCINMLKDNEISAPFDFKSLPVQVNHHDTSMKFTDSNPNFTRNATINFINNCRADNVIALINQHPTLIFDYSFVVMRKRPAGNRTKLTPPTQSMYA